ncbi:3-oxoacyl-(acyl-carrier) reductase [Fusarium agapanthi]|uniref:3-oxoacyl-(Acyl-carrier) reductase n=1 Tax=Fusarium agapanthi TaxID=1803897 RepID=A0A9P5BE03_9HYPO|nr:3-oxoacyl-(acyl-carrier) reductase [Fusarium agapanthi]
MCVIPDRILDLHTKMLLHYCTQSFWSCFEIGSAAFHIPPFALDYNILVAQGPALVHACLWQAAVNLAFKRNSRVTDKQSLLHYNQAIAHISKDMAKPVAEIPEQTLYAIISLCGPEMSPDDGNGITKKAFDPPDLIQQRLLATLPDGYDGKKPVQRDASGSPETTADHWTNEIVQTALLVFSLGVACPISYAPPYHHAAQRLQAQLILYKEQAVYLGLSDLLIWLGMLGILCTEQVGSGLREWFVGFLGRVEQKRRVAEDAREWDEVSKESLEPVLWTSVACYTAAERAWHDVQGVANETSWNWALLPPINYTRIKPQSIMSLDGKAVLVTGGSKGIGKAVIERVAANGASVVINYSSDSKPAEELFSKIGPYKALAFKADVSNIAEIEKLVQATLEKFGKIDCVMANAACAPMNELESTTEAGFDKAFNLNVKGPYFLVQASFLKAVKHMSRDGRVILVSSGVLHQSQVSPLYLLYASSKGSIEQMTRILAKDLGPKGITVNAIAPGPTATEMFFQGKSQELIDTIAGFSPLGRLGKPEEIAALAPFLLVQPVPGCLDR